MPLLELKNVSVNYGSIRALKEINLTVDKGEIITLIGANGAGKKYNHENNHGPKTMRPGDDYV